MICNSPPAADVERKLRFNEFCKQYEEDFPSYDHIDVEIDLWQIHINSGYIAKHDDIASTLRGTDPVSFPNIYIALRILGTVPVTTF